MSRQGHSAEFCNRFEWILSGRSMSWLRFPFIPFLISWVCRQQHFVAQEHHRLSEITGTFHLPWMSHHSSFMSKNRPSFKGLLMVWRADLLHKSCTIKLLEAETFWHQMLCVCVRTFILYDSSQWKLPQVQVLRTFQMLGGSQIWLCTCTKLMEMNYLTPKLPQRQREFLRCQMNRFHVFPVQVSTPLKQKLLLWFLPSLILEEKSSTQPP